MSDEAASAPLTIRLHDGHGRWRDFLVPFAALHVSYKGHLYALQPRFRPGVEEYMRCAAYELDDSMVAKNKELG